MKILKRPWFIPTLLTVVILVAGGVFVGSLVTKEELLPESEIQARLENIYGGTVKQLSIRNEVYHAEMIRGEAVYSATIDAVTGSILSLVQTGKTGDISGQLLLEADVQKVIAEKYTGTTKRISLDKSGDKPVYEVEIAQNKELLVVEIDGLSGEVISENVKETTVEHALITKEQAVEIALGQLKGEVEYVTFEKTNDGGYYLIEIDGEDEEAEIQIHAISGEILSTTWDD
ncbi:PepSY domain-containing protein [Filibacter tadaridae]|uniref:Peptidase propeptide and YPEB domain protein n=1 Tax=Filibacter tadaridae TaxID=2483811 RepID=A0A3P5WL26_9BACL|nr:PepSY domain-containing protein [Filibacter tadaridae]VDC22378.1 Peptidase propeptide and YPEB domain protein [Filibacter tadaridae]